jgi:DnaJ family protein A protein 1
LSDEKKRQIYDEGGEQAIKEGLDKGGGGFSSPMDIFDMFFGGNMSGRRGGERGPKKGKDVVHQLSVSLEDLYKGSVRKLALQKKVICDNCEGNCRGRDY